MGSRQIETESLIFQRISVTATLLATSFKVMMTMMMKTTMMMKMIVVQVAEKERAQRLLEIYNRMDARSHVVHEGKKFKKSDILQVGK